MDARAMIYDLLENNDNNSAFEFYDIFDRTKRGAYFVLDYLNKNQGEVISADLSNSLDVSTARMTKLLQKLEKKKLIIKQKSKVDARKIIISLTDKGKRSLDIFKNMIINFIDCIIDEIGEEKFKDFILISREIQDSIEKRKLLKTFK